MDYTEMPKPDQPEVDSHRHCSVCRLVTNNSSVLVSLSRVVDLRSIIRHWVLHASVCDAAFTFGSSNVIWPCWPQRREAGRVPDFAPFSPSLCPLFKRPAPAQTQYHHCGLFTAEKHSEGLATLLSESENIHMQIRMHPFINTATCTPGICKKILQDLVPISWSGVIFTHFIEYCDVPLTHICFESALTWPLHALVLILPVSLSLPQDNWKRQSPLLFCVCTRSELRVLFNIESDVSEFKRRKLQLFCSETCAHLPLRSEPGNVQANCEPYWVQRCVFWSEGERESGRGRSSWLWFKGNQEKVLCFPNALVKACFI